MSLIATAGIAVSASEACVRTNLKSRVKTAVVPCVREHALHRPFSSQCDKLVVQPPCKASGDCPLRGCRTSLLIQSSTETLLSGSQIELHQLPAGFSVSPIKFQSCLPWFSSPLRWTVTGPSWDARLLTPLSPYLFIEISVCLFLNYVNILANGLWMHLI